MATKKTAEDTKVKKTATTKTNAGEGLETQSPTADQRETTPDALPVDPKHEAKVDAQKGDADAAAEAERLERRDAVKRGEIVPDKTFAVGEPTTEEAKVDRLDIAKREADATNALFGDQGDVAAGGYRGHGTKLDEWERLEATKEEFRVDESAEDKDNKTESRRIDASTWYADEGQKMQSQGHSTRSILGRYYADLTVDQEKNNKISDVMNAHQDLVKQGKVKDLFDKL